jgi:hypothetical protein
MNTQEHINPTRRKIKIQFQFSVFLKMSFNYYPIFETSQLVTMIKRLQEIGHCATFSSFVPLGKSVNLSGKDNFSL